MIDGTFSDYWTLDVMESAIALSALAVLALVNSFATWIAVRDRYAERRHKVFQVLAIWLVPVLGAIFIFALYRKPEKPTGRYRESLDPPWDDFASNKYVGRAVNTHADDQP